jgi:hypothetical protein
MRRSALLAISLCLALACLDDARADKLSLRFPPGSAGCPPPAGTETSTDVDGDMAADWLLYRMTDKNGQDIDIWCTARGYRVKFSFPGAAPVWIGGCFFDGGRNTSVAQVDLNPQTGETVFEGVSHDNVDPGSEDDLHFRFNPATKKLRIQKTKKGEPVGEPREIDAPSTVVDLEKLIGQIRGVAPTQDNQTGSRCILTPEFAARPEPSRQPAFIALVALAVVLALAVLLLLRRRRA